MSEYEKLTVVKLRDELVKRGLPKTGLKAALVQRLQEADSQAQSADTPDDRKTNGSSVEGLEDGITEPQEESAPTSTRPITTDAIESAPDVADGKFEAKDDTNETRAESVVGENTTLVPQPSSPARQQILNDEQSPSNTLSVKTISRPPGIDEIEDRPDLHGDSLPGDQSHPHSQEPEKSVQSPTPMETEPEQHIKTPTIDTQELLEDSRKRKRRSQSPPPSFADTQKRLKADDALPRVTLPEDLPLEHEHSNPDIDSDPASTKIIPSDSMPDLNGYSTFQGETKRHEKNGEAGTVESPDSKTAESHRKPSSSDPRFKNLFTTPTTTEQPSQQLPYQDNEDRVTSPAIHPATSALYIRELMRPLKPESIRDHLMALATPADTTTDTSIITEFFLDSIRTHCLVGFGSTSAAARVRSGLHDRIWPNERDRRPLFVDFIPEEKVRKWIDVEQNASSGRGQAQKRWEVIYGVEDGTVKAYLQEVGTNNGGLRATQPTIANTGQGVVGAPSGPRIEESKSGPTHARPDNGKGFQALDDLFKSTMAKPKLYYQPVLKATVEHRLDRLAAGRGGGRSDEMRRYTFEDDVFVDRAPEFGNRGRGGYGNRGGFPNGYRGRGGSYRGDGYRGPGEGWRDRRSGY